MKNIALMCLVLVTIVSCDSDENINPLKGDWNWTSTCGGVTGQCGYPDQDNAKIIEITNDKIVTIENGVHTTEMTYVILNRTTDDDRMLLKIKIDGGNVVLVSTVNDELTIERGDFWESYERIRYPQLTRQR